MAIKKLPCGSALHRQAKKARMCNLLPIPRRSSGDCTTGSSPDSGSSFIRAFPKHCSSDVVCGFTLRYSGGTVLALHQTSLLSPEGHLFRFIKFLFMQPITTLRAIVRPFKGGQRTKCLHNCQFALYPLLISEGR